MKAFIAYKMRTELHNEKQFRYVSNSENVDFEHKTSCFYETFFSLAEDKFSKAELLLMYVATLFKQLRFLSSWSPHKSFLASTLRYICRPVLGQG